MGRYYLEPISGNVPAVTLNTGSIVYSGTTGTPNHSRWDDVDYYYGSAVFNRLTIRSSTPIWTSNQQLTGKYGGENFTFEIECTHEFDPEHSAGTSGWRVTLNVTNWKIGSHNISGAAGYSGGISNQEVEDGWEPGDAGIYAYTGSWDGHSGIWFICGALGKPEATSKHSNAFFTSDSFWADIPVKEPYESIGDIAKAGDPTESGGWGHGIPKGTPAATSATKPNIFPFGSGLHVYRISSAQLASLSDYLWGRNTTVFDADGLWGRFKNYKFNPIAGVLSCHSLPTSLMPAASGSASIAIAGTTLALASGSPVGNTWTSWKTPNTLYLDEPTRSYSDYLFPKCMLYLPFCGSLNVDISAIMGGYLYVRYYCDIISGNVAAWVIGKNRFSDSPEQLIATATGNVAYQIPVTGNDQGTGEILGTIKGAVSNAISGNFGGMATQLLFAGTEQHHTQVSGSHHGNAGYCASTEVYATISWPIPVESPNYNAMRGRPSEFSGSVGAFSGYCEFDVHADSIGQATEQEKRDIERMLREGVIV